MGSGPDFLRFGVGTAGTNKNIIAEIRQKPIGHLRCQVGITGGDFSAVAEQPTFRRRGTIGKKNGYNSTDWKRGGYVVGS